MEVRFFAGAAEAAGVDSLVLVTPVGKVGDLVEELSSGNPALAKVLGVSSLLADGRRVSLDEDLSGVVRVDVLPPFAGG